MTEAPVEPTPPPTGWRRFLPLIGALAAIGCCIGALAFDGDDPAPAPPTPPVTAADTCNDWNAKTRSAQQASARTMLTALRQRDGRPVPADIHVARFAAGLTEACSVRGELDLLEAAITLYLIGKPAEF